MKRFPFSPRLIACILVGLCAAPYPSLTQTTFLKTLSFGVAAQDFAYSVQQTSDGGYILTGNTGSLGSTNMFLIKTNPTGDTLWTKQYGPGGGNSVLETADGGYMIAGSTSTAPWGPCDVYLVKTNEVGDTLWTRTIGDPADREQVNAIQQTPDGGYIAVGSFSDEYGSSSALLGKITSSGDTAWVRTYSVLNGFSTVAFDRTSDGGCILLASNPFFGEVVTLIKTDSTGDTLWTRAYGHEGTGVQGYGVEQTSEGGFVFTGEAYPTGSMNPDLYLVRTSPSGDTVWTRTFGGSYPDGGRYVQQTTDGGFIAAGRTNSHGAGLFDVYLVKVTAAGTLDWWRTFGGSKYDEGCSVQQTSDGGYIVVGDAQDFDASTADILLIKTDAGGLASVGTDGVSIPAVFALSQNYPNPFNPGTNIRFELPKALYVRLSVYDILGHEVLILVNEKRDAGTHELKFDGSGLASGLYVYRIQAGNFVQSKKLVLLK